MAKKLEALIAKILETHPIGFDLGLENIRKLLAKLGNPHLFLPPIFHIAGTNGKGSISAFCRALLEAKGLRVHTHTSPHLVQWVERFRLANTKVAKSNLPYGCASSSFVEEDILCQTLEQILAINGEAPITLFEILTAAAFVLFKAVPADAVILEVGLGGRYDATNIIERPACTIIGPIAYDHEHFLGKDIAQIAFEKAGIIKQSCPVVIGKQNFEAAQTKLVEIAQKKDAPFSLYGQDYFAYNENQRMIFQDQTQLLDLPLPKLLGIHQIENAATALMAVQQAGFELKPAIIEQAWQNVHWPARLQKLDKGKLFNNLSQKKCEIWLDGGHNPHAAQALAQAILELHQKQPLPLSFIIAMLDKKNGADYLQNLLPLKALYPEFIFIPLKNNASFPPKTLLEKAKELGFQAKKARNLEHALKDLSLKAHQRVFIAGSLYLCGEALAMNDSLPT